MKLSLLLLIYIGFHQLPLAAQEQKAVITDTKESKMKFTMQDGTVIAGYVDKGAFFNFTGPNISHTKNNTKIMFGMLPSLRIKEDNKEPKNSVITPSLGVGLTCCYKRIAFQFPFYYNIKTANTDGKWNFGIGIGIRLKNN